MGHQITVKGKPFKTYKPNFLFLNAKVNCVDCKLSALSVTVRPLHCHAVHLGPAPYWLLGLASKVHWKVQHWEHIVVHSSLGYNGRW